MHSQYFFTIILLCAIFYVSTGTKDIDAISSLNENRLQIIGDMVTIESKNDTTVDYLNDDTFDDYLKNHYIRIKLFDEVTDIDMKDIFLQENDVEGRSKLKKVLLPILLALKLKMAIVVPVMMSLIALVAVKGLWSGMAALVISKIMALKAIFHRHHHDYHDYNDHHDHHDHHDHAHHNIHEYWSKDDGDKSYIIYYPGDRQRIRATNRGETVTEQKNNYEEYYQSENNQQQKWANIPSQWENTNWQ